MDEKIEKHHNECIAVRWRSQQRHLFKEKQKYEKSRVALASHNNARKKSDNRINLEKASD